MTTVCLHLYLYLCLYRSFGGREATVHLSTLNKITKHHDMTTNRLINIIIYIIYYIYNQLTILVKAKPNLTRKHKPLHFLKGYNQGRTSFEWPEWPTGFQTIYLGGPFFFLRQFFNVFLDSWFYAFLFLWFSAFLRLWLHCFSAFLLFAFPASLLFLLCFSAFCFSCFFAFLLSVFPASLLLYFCAFLLLLFYCFVSSVMCFCCSTSCSFASLLPVFSVSLFLIFFCFILFCLYPKWNPRETLGETQRNPLKKSW